MGQPLAQKFAGIATQYAQDVVDGKLPACKWVKLACARHLRDLARSQNDPAWPYVFNPELVDGKGRQYYPAERICRFAELMPHIKGDWAGRGELIKLEPWQVFILASIFGWRYRKTGRRRFRVADVFVPRKNAKSTIAAVIGLYCLAADDEFGAEVYSGATSQKQALEVFKPALQMARATPDFRAKYGVVVNASNLSITDTNSKFEPVIGKPGDGASPSCAIVDEFHEHKTPELYDTMATGMGARSQPLMLVITTSGTDVSGPCYMHETELHKILEEVTENEQRFGIIYTVDEGDDWTSEAALIKANPNYGISVDAEYLRGMQLAAIEDPSKQNVFKTKHLNIWCAAASPWVNLHNVQACGDPSLKLEAFKGQECVVGLDLASVTDLAAKLYLFRRVIGSEDHYYAITRAYAPKDAVNKPENAHYQGWVHGGHLVATEGNMIDLQRIQEEISQDAEVVKVKEVAKDPWGGQQLGANLAAEGFEVVDVPQQVRYLSAPMKFINGIIDGGRFHHDANPVFVWCMSNVEVQEDRNENIFPRKQRAVNKIDLAVALIIAMSRSMVVQPAQTGIDNWLRSAA